MLASAACNAEQGKAAAKDPEVIAAAVPAPKNGDWSAIVTKTPEGGFLMGNPNAKVKLVEFGSLTCHVCADFEERGGKALVDNYVKKGLVSWEFRNFVRDPFDMAASLLARCGGEAGFFGLTRNLFTDQKIWVGKIQATDPAKVQALQAMPPMQQFSTIADLGGLKDYAAMRGVSRAKGEQCLTNQAEVTRLVQMNTDAASTYNIPGTPTFLINGTVVDQAYSWDALEPRIKEALAS
jgi:protein-disulfide isomerase